MRTAHLILLMVGVGALATSAMAQSSGGVIACGDRNDVVGRLHSKFGEVQKGAGLLNPAQLLEVFRSDKTGTWTILMTDAHGQSCVVAAGDAWRDIDSDVIAKGDPA